MTKRYHSEFGPLWLHKVTDGEAVKRLTGDSFTKEDGTKCSRNESLALKALVKNFSS